MISQFSVFKKIDLNTQEVSFIINTGDIHNILPKFNLMQSNEIKKIIQNSSTDSLFLFEYPFNLELDNDDIKRCKNASELTVNTFHNPIFLFNFAKLYDKAHCNIDYRPHTFIFNIFSNLLQDFINSKNTGKRELNIRFSDISKLMISSFDKVQADYNELKQAAEELGETASSKKTMIDVYIESFDRYAAIFQENKNYAEEIGQIEVEIIDYLIDEFAKYKNCEPEIIVNGLIDNDLDLAKEFGYYSGQNCIQKIGISFLNTIELNALKEIINNSSMSKIFLFIGSIHANAMNETLVKCGYEKIYETIATPIEIVHQLSARGINIVSADIEELVPVSSEFLSKLSAKELTKELFEIKFKKAESCEIPQVPTSWIRKICNFLNL